MKHARETYKEAKAIRSRIIAKKSAEEVKRVCLKINKAKEEGQMFIYDEIIIYQKTVKKLKELGYRLKAHRGYDWKYDISWDQEQKRPFTATVKGLLSSIIK